jgi:AcrR family transcriptional regulator
VVSDTSVDDEGEFPDAFTYPLLAVAKALARHGYADLTTKKIAAESTRTEAALYRHYDSKEGLVAAFLEAAVGWFSWELEHVGTTDPIERLERTCAVLTGDRIDWEYFPGLYVAMQELGANATRNEAFGEPLRTYNQFVVDSLADVVRDGVEEDVFRDVEPEPVAAVLAALGDAVPRYSLVYGMPEEADAIRDHLFSYIRSELVAEGRSN